MYLAKDPETMQSRGFAFVSYYQKSDAESAMQGLQGYGYDHLILKLEWAKPSLVSLSLSLEFGGGRDRICVEFVPKYHALLVSHVCLPFCGQAFFLCLCFNFVGYVPHIQGGVLV